MDETWELSKRSMAKLRKALLSSDEEEVAAKWERDESGRRKRDGRGVVISKPHDPRATRETGGEPERDTQGYRKDKPFDPRTRGGR